MPGFLGIYNWNWSEVRGRDRLADFPDLTRHTGTGLIILDLMMPGMSGIEVCRRVRRESDVPIIILTAKDDISDKVTGLDTGADDYMTKPFAIEELLARIRAALKRRSPIPTEETIVIDMLEINPTGRQVFYDGEPVELTKKEYD